jgi:hypothetical protein
MRQLSDLDDGELATLALELNNNMLAMVQMLEAMRYNCKHVQAELVRRRDAYKAIPATVAHMLERASHGG